MVVGLVFFTLAGWLAADWRESGEGIIINIIIIMK
jgi:uncharacterized membrane protein YeaQ/YmgE (transglycosylase-associated protein family)